MKSISTLAITLALAATAMTATPAEAQRRGKKAEPAAVDPNARKYTFSAAARPSIAALQASVNANDAAGFATNLAAAQAVASTTDDKYAIAQLQLQYALATQNVPAQATALDALVASGGATQTELPKLYGNIASLAYDAKNYDKAAFGYERLTTLNPNDSQSLVMLGEIRNRQGRVPEGVQFIERAIAARIAAGQPVDETWYKRAVGLSTDAKLVPQATKLTRDWVSAYPTTQNWRDALNNYRFLVPLQEDAELDRFRLTRAAGALQGERDYKRFADYLMFRKIYGEAKSVLDEGVSRRIVDAKKPEYAALITQANARAAADRPTIASSEGRAQSAATGSVAANVADAYLGYGDYGKAATFYRTALTKGGEDANAINTRLGIALAMSGDKAGATTAFDAVTGPRQSLAEYWKLWLSKRA